MDVFHPVIANLVAVVLLFDRGWAAAQVPRVRIEDFQNVSAFEVADSPKILLLHGKSLIVGSFHDATLCVFNLKTERRTHRFVFLKSGKDVEFVEDDGGKTFDRNSISPLSAIVAARGNLFVLTAFAESLLVLDSETFELKAILPVGGSGKLAVSPEERFVYHASNTEPKFNIIDTSTHKIRSVPYPQGGRGIGAIAVSSDGHRLYLGIQRGGSRKHRLRVGGGNAFLAVYDLAKERYTGTVYLAVVRNGYSDDSIPSTLLVNPQGLLYIGMRQSVHAYRVVAPGRLAIDHDVDLPVPHDPSYRYPWPNVSAGAIDRNTLISLNRGGEVHLWDTKRKRLLGILELGTLPGRWPNAAVLHKGMLYIAHPQYKCVYVVHLDEWRRRLHLN